ncbi:RrF2 family transcriptional regulator [Aestuariivivens insulae]|uniref:RrF2 family transcriptional regulator n=1 Tax=Aestuariivivens insulae TaxID=1621988 RepID=UPI001F5AD740|nr:Rrf2 family transcriptional regulator [Aestuariivivens insulae]
MLSIACKNAIRSVLYLALKSNGENKVGAKSIANALDIPQPFLSKLLQQLAKNNLVSSTKGPNGGFYLSEKNKENTIWDIIISIDGGNKFDECFLGLSVCDDKNPCPVHAIVAPFKVYITENFRGKTILEYSNEIKKTGKLISLKDFNPLGDKINKSS